MDAWACLLGTRPVWNRDTEASLVGAVIDAIAQHRAPVSDREADVYRFSAQLLRTRYLSAHDFLNEAAQQFFAGSGVLPRSFPQIVADGLVSDVSRLRHLLEDGMAGLRTW